MNLQQYAEADSETQRTGHVRCKTCSLPSELRTQVEAGRRQEPPIAWTVISRWLASKEYRVNPNTLKNHFDFGHAS